jgi:hypothetical protein
MAGAKIDGTAIAKSIRQGLKAEIEQLQVTNPRFKPNLIIFQGKQRRVGCDERERMRLILALYSRQSIGFQWV